MRLQCNGSGASAGIHVEELNEKKDLNDSGRQSSPWKTHCKQKSDNHDGKSGSRPDSHDFWRMVHGPHIPIDAIGLGGVVALGVQMGHFSSLHQQYKTPERTRQRCLLSALVLHALPPETDTRHKSTQRNIVNKEESRKHKRNTSSKHDSTSLKHSRGSSLLETVHEQDERETKVTNQAAKSTAECESLEQAFQNFEKVCQRYTATGKGVMASQEVQQGNMKSAAVLWKEASELGNAKSRFNLGVCYEAGIGVKKDLEQAVRLYTMAAEDLHPQAMYNLGLMYLEGTAHTPKDTHKGLKLLSTAADFGLPEAQCYLGVYYTGEQTENEKKAVHYLTLAANQQNAEAQYFLGLCYQHGYGVDENLCKASHLFSKAAESGHPEATYSVAIFHQQGLGGLPQDQHCAKRLLEKAAAAGCQDAIHEIHKSQKARNSLSAVVKRTTDPSVKKSEESESKEVTYQFKLNNSVSSPCLTDLLRQNMIPLNKDLFCDPVSDSGTLSKLYTQLMVPRGLTMTKTVPKVPQSRTPSPTIADSDSGVVFKLGSGIGEEDFGRTLDEVALGDIGMTCSGLYRRTSTMPDLNVVTCL